MTPRIEVARNKPGWYAIRHEDGWFVGDNAGALCYADREIARAAMTIIWQRQGGGRLAYEVVVLKDADLHQAGEVTPLKSSEQALRDYENPRRK